MPVETKHYRKLKRQIAADEARLDKSRKHLHSASRAVKEAKSAITYYESQDGDLDKQNAAYAKQIAEYQKSMNKLKADDKKGRADYQKKIDDVDKKLKANNDQIGKNKTTIAKKQGAISRATHSSKSSNHGIYRNKNKLNRAKKKYSKYIKKRHKKALTRIKGEDAENRARFGVGHASIHATNSLTGLVVFLFSNSEEETNENEITEYQMDRDDPVSDHSHRSSKGVTVTGYLFAQKKGKRKHGRPALVKKTTAKQFANLKKWSYDGEQLVYKSNPKNKSHHTNRIYYKHLVIQDVNRTLDQPLDGALKISITFKFVYKAQARSTKGRHKSKGKKQSKGKYTGSKNIKIKAGMSYWALSRKYHVSIKQLESWNKYPAGSLPVGSRIRVSEGSRKKRK